MTSCTILVGDCREQMGFLDDGCAHCCVTSPPYYGLRDYGHAGQIGREETIAEYVGALVETFRAVRRVLRDDGTLWVNLGDSYNADNRTGHGSRVGHKQGTNRASAAGMDATRPRSKDVKPKDLMGIPWRVAFALQDDGWYLRSDIIWAKPNPMPESVKDRPTKSHEYIFLFAKQEQYYYDADAIAEPVSSNPVTAARNGRADKGIVGTSGLFGTEHGQSGRGGFERADMESRNKRSVWQVALSPYKGAHFATYPPELIKPCILAGCPEGGTVIDPFGGSGTTGRVALDHNRSAILCELNPEFAELARSRTQIIQGDIFCE